MHWYYNLTQLKQDYGAITGYTKPREQFVGSIMNLSNTGGGGRGSDEGSIIGDVICHGKKHYWQKGGNFHYHVSLQAGENTLEAQLVRLLLRTMAEKTDFTFDNFRNAYIKFMTTPGSHNDTYASTAHRMFFANYVKKIDPQLCPDNDGHNVDAIDALTLAVPIILKNSDLPKEQLYKLVNECISVTRKTTKLQPYSMALTDILVDVLNGADLRSAIDSVDHRLFNTSIKSTANGPDPMAACYIDSSFPALLHFAYKYADSPEQAILANANAGGENVARGSLLGALIGAAHGPQAW